MALYSRYLVCYDIADNKSRTRFTNFLKDLGLFPAQKSVFIGELNQAEINSLNRYAHENLDSATDKVFWIPSDIDIERLKKGIGYDNFQLIRADDSHVI